MKSIIKQRLKVFLWGVLGIIIFLEIALRGLGLFYSVKSRQDKPDSQSRYSVLCVGDSFVFGCGAPFGKSFPAQLEALLNSNKAAKVYSVTNRGIPGQNTTQLLENLDNYIETVRPDVIVILSGGANSWNFEGYQTYLRGKSLWASLYNCLYRVRVFKLVKLLVMLKETSTYKKDIQSAPLESESFAAQGRDMSLDMSQSKRIREIVNEYGKDAAIGMDMDSQGLKVDDAYAGLGNINPNEGNLEEAKNIFLSKAQTQPGGERFTHLPLGFVKDDSKTKEFKVVNAINNSNRLGYRSLMQGDLEEAFKYFKEAVRTHPEEDNSYDALGTINQLRGNSDEALKWYKEAIARNPKEVRYYAHIANTYEQRGDFREATDFFKSSRKYIGKTADDYILMFKKGDGRLENIREWIRDDIERIIVTCRRKKVKVILQTYPSGWVEHRSILEQMAHKYSVSLVDHLEVFMGLGNRSGEFFAEDGHCNSLGYGIMAKNIYKVMLQEKMIGLDENAL